MIQHSSIHASGPALRTQPQSRDTVFLRAPSTRQSLVSAPAIKYPERSGVKEGRCVQLTVLGHSRHHRKVRQDLGVAGLTCSHEQTTKAYLPAWSAPGPNPGDGAAVHSGQTFPLQLMQSRQLPSDISIGQPDLHNTGQPDLHNNLSRRLVPGNSILSRCWLPSPCTLLWKLL